MPFRSEGIEDLCKQTGLTQRELAALIGVPQSTIYRWLHDISDPTLPHLDALYNVAQQRGVNTEFYRKPE